MAADTVGIEPDSGHVTDAQYVSVLKRYAYGEKLKALIDVYDLAVQAPNPRAAALAEEWLVKGIRRTYGHCGSQSPGESNDALIASLIARENLPAKVLFACIDRSRYNHDNYYWNAGNSDKAIAGLLALGELDERVALASLSVLSRTTHAEEVAAFSIRAGLSPEVEKKVGLRSNCNYEKRSDFPKSL
ncbi:TPA: hypothetical protein HA316_02815, partial [Candidatus Micrarchaeota archaeon]|nr:hypothetical protein [Candidatus Micrarchaeota archaeon]